MLKRPTRSERKRAAAKSRRNRRRAHLQLSKAERAKLAASAIPEYDKA